jgi:hypothetical protein
MKLYIYIYIYIYIYVVTSCKILNNVTCLNGVRLCMLLNVIKYNFDRKMISPFHLNWRDPYFLNRAHNEISLCLGTVIFFNYFLKICLVQFLKFKFHSGFI